MTDIFDSRRRNLEETFFAKHNRRLLEQMRQRASHQARKESLAEASGIEDEALLDELAGLGLSGETLAAFTLIPLVQVAWGDGSVEKRERWRILDSARSVGIEPGSAAHQLIESWLESCPCAEMMEAWKAYASSLSRKLSPEGREALRRDTIEKARRVAKAAGGFFGVVKSVSAGEKEVLAELENALAGD